MDSLLLGETKGLVRYLLPRVACIVVLVGIYRYKLIIGNSCLAVVSNKAE